MFGRIHKKRTKKREAQKNEMLDKKNAEANEQKEKHSAIMQKQQVADKSAESRGERQRAREEGRSDTESFLSKDVQGLDPQKRQALQYEANKNIQRGHQAANRKLLGDQASHGIVGKGGVGYAQQRDLQKMASELQGGVHRDLTKLDRDLALKKQAAIFAGGQGEATQQHLDKQLALDELQLADERKRQKFYEDQFNRQFSRI